MRVEALADLRAAGSSEMAMVPLADGSHGLVVSGSETRFVLICLRSPAHERERSAEPLCVTTECEYSQSGKLRGVATSGDGQSGRGFRQRSKGAPRHRALKGNAPPQTLHKVTSAASHLCLRSVRTAPLVWCLA